VDSELKEKTKKSLEKNSGNRKQEKPASSGGAVAKKDILLLPGLWVSQSWMQGCRQVSEFRGWSLRFMQRRKQKNEIQLLRLLQAEFQV
jgi:hypothetical protein